MGIKIELKNGSYLGRPWPSASRLAAMQNGEQEKQTSHVVTLDANTELDIRLQIVFAAKSTGLTVKETTASGIIKLTFFGGEPGDLDIFAPRVDEHVRVLRSDPGSNIKISLKDLEGAKKIKAANLEKIQNSKYELFQQLLSNAQRGAAWRKANARNFEEIEYFPIVKKSHSEGPSVHTLSDLIYATAPQYGLIIKPDMDTSNASPHGEHGSRTWGISGPRAILYPYVSQINLFKLDKQHKLDMQTVDLMHAQAGMLAIEKEYARQAAALRVRG